MARRDQDTGDQRDAITRAILAQMALQQSAQASTPFPVDYRMGSPQGTSAGDAAGRGFTPGQGTVPLDRMFDLPPTTREDFDRGKPTPIPESDRERGAPVPSGVPLAGRGGRGGSEDNSDVIDSIMGAVNAPVPTGAPVTTGIPVGAPLNPTEQDMYDAAQAAGKTPAGRGPVDTFSAPPSGTFSPGFNMFGDPIAPPGGYPGEHSDVPGGRGRGGDDRESGDRSTPDPGAMAAGRAGYDFGLPAGTVVAPGGGLVTPGAPATPGFTGYTAGIPSENTPTPATTSAPAAPGAIGQPGAAYSSQPDTVLGRTNDFLAEGLGAVGRGAAALGIPGFSGYSPGWGEHGAPMGMPGGPLAGGAAVGVPGGFTGPGIPAGGAFTSGGYNTTPAVGTPTNGWGGMTPAFTGRGGFTTDLPASRGWGDEDTTPTGRSSLSDEDADAIAAAAAAMGTPSFTMSMISDVVDPDTISPDTVAPTGDTVAPSTPSFDTISAISDFADQAATAAQDAADAAAAAAAAVGEGEAGGSTFGGGTEGVGGTEGLGGSTEGGSTYGGSEPDPGTSTTGFEGVGFGEGVGFEGVGTSDPGTGED
jgi:hypothetical protein